MIKHRGERLHSRHWNGATLALLTIGDSTAVIPVGPNCQESAEQVQCRDEILGIEFAYPLPWGSIEAELRPGGYSGTIYTYHFNPTGDLYPYAGGLSADFSEGRGGWYTDFRGYGTGGGSGSLCQLQCNAL